MKSKSVLESSYKSGSVAKRVPYIDPSPQDTVGCTRVCNYHEVKILFEEHEATHNENLFYQQNESANHLLIMPNRLMLDTKDQDAVKMEMDANDR